MIASIVVASIALANYLGKRTDAANDRIDDLRKEMVRGFDDLRGEIVRGFENLNKRIDDLRTDLCKWVEVMEADIRELRAPILSQASGNLFSGSGIFANRRMPRSELAAARGYQAVRGRFDGP